MFENRSFRGTVAHSRRAPQRHGFRYPVWMLYVDLDCVSTLPVFRPRLLASVDRGHLMTPAEVRAMLAEPATGGRMRLPRQPADKRGAPPSARRDTRKERGRAYAIHPPPSRRVDAMSGLTPTRIFVLTQPRSLGISFNPVNFYFCFLEKRLAALLVDINNTPWDERYCYVLLPEGGTQGSPEQSFRFPKQFHVSPFLPMDGEYVLRLKLSSNTLRIAMRLDGDAAPFSACLSLRGAPLSRVQLLSGALRRPAQGLQTLARIYWQAGRLFLKRTPFHAHPAKHCESAKPVRPTRQHSL